MALSETGEVGDLVEGGMVTEQVTVALCYLSFIFIHALPPILWDFH